MSERMRQHWLHGLLELCLLSLLAERRDYGLGLAERLAAAGLDEVAGGTLYPSLLRLDKRGLVRTEREPSSAGPPRKYYELTAAGHVEVLSQLAAWEQFRTAVDALTASRPKVR